MKNIHQCSQNVVLNWIGVSQVQSPWLFCSFLAHISKNKQTMLEFRMKISVLFSLQMCNICKGAQLSDVLALRIKRESDMCS